MMLLEERTPWATNYIQACQTWALMGMISFKVFKNKRLIEDAPSAVRVSSRSSCELQKSTEKHTPALLRLLASILSSVISLAAVGKKTLMSVRLWEKLPRRRRLIHCSVRLPRYGNLRAFELKQDRSLRSGLLFVHLALY